MGELPGGSADGRADEQVDYVDAEDRPVRTGPRGGARAIGLHHRVAATVLTDPAGRVLVHRRPAHAPVLPGHHDVLVGGCVRAGESYRAAAARELAEELGVGTGGPPPRELWRERLDGPNGPCWLAVHHLRLGPGGPPQADPAEIAWHGFVPYARLVRGNGPAAGEAGGVRPPGADGTEGAGGTEGLGFRAVSGPGARRTPPRHPPRPAHPARSARPASPPRAARLPQPPPPPMPSPLARPARDLPSAQPARPAREPRPGQGAPGPWSARPEQHPDSARPAQTPASAPLGATDGDGGGRPAHPCAGFDPIAPFNPVGLHVLRVLGHLEHRRDGVPAVPALTRGTHDHCWTVLGPCPADPCACAHAADGRT
ncbi:NUDIX domain-containing protein [Streptomyces cacaoi]|uniref:Nudix hydrolase domain-containing protein n=1 Tax=Streptomyces cacaoi TaxID=1898 RepID=A0A4Y3R5M9_STRCI|nr:NUDIX domain-containing protein [Streptomyces cacaoi]GEB52038.1 hypothetical protein SCA03_45890 [Streptomyces cacaoi]